MKKVKIDDSDEMTFLKKQREKDDKENKQIVRDLMRAEKKSKKPRK